MRRPEGIVVLAIALFSAHMPGASFEQGANSVLQVRVDLLKKTPWEANHVRGPVVVGPQAGIDVEWQIRYFGQGVVSIPLPSALDVRVTLDGAQIPIRLFIATEMKVNRIAVPTTSVSVEDKTTLVVRAVVNRDDGRPFHPGVYRLELDLQRLRDFLISDDRADVFVDHGFPIELWIQALDTPVKVRHYHLIEGAFYSDTEPERALDHRMARVAMPDAEWTDWLALGKAYATLSRHGEAVGAYRRILPVLLEASSDARRLLRDAGNFRTVAMSFAVAGDRATAEAILKAEGVLRVSEIPGAIERLRQTALMRQH